MPILTLRSPNLPKAATQGQGGTEACRAQPGPHGTPRPTCGRFHAGAACDFEVLRTRATSCLGHPPVAGAILGLAGVPEQKKSPVPTREYGAFGFSLIFTGRRPIPDVWLSRCRFYQGMLVSTARTPDEGAGCIATLDARHFAA